MLAKCDECATEFKVDSFEDTVTKDYEKTSFFCPACGQEYIAFAKDSNIKKKQAEIKEMYVKMRKPGTNYQMQQKIMLGIKRKEAEVRSDMNDLKKELI